MPLALPPTVHTCKLLPKLVLEASLTHGKVTKGIQVILFVVASCAAQDTHWFKRPNTRPLSLMTSFNDFKAFNYTRRHFLPLRRSFWGFIFAFVVEYSGAQE